MKTPNSMAVLLVGCGSGGDARSGAVVRRPRTLSDDLTTRQASGPSTDGVR